ncbi:MAG: SDR family oxidoreductase [Mangrovicoccus sp.]|nr:SDR family oxidoreductase [Mangrovicoccus sp.]
MQKAKTMLITGGSRGIGRAVALAAAARGWDVAITYRQNQAEAEGVARSVRALGCRAEILSCDIANEEQVQRMFAQASDLLDGLDYVVLNAGIVAPSMRLADMEGARLREMVNTNLLGTLYAAREAARLLPRPKSAQSAAIVILSSAAARLGSPFEYVDYAATKGALDSLTLGLAKELAPDNIRVNAVRPGLIETDIHASGGQPDRAARLGAQVPLGRPGRADEIAEAVLWLCSEAASYTTGALLDVAGGR